MNLGAKLRNRRLELDLTLEEVGDMVGVSKSTVMKWETGYIENMRKDKIALLAKALKVSPLWVMGIDEKPKAKPRTVAAHLEGVELSERESEELSNFIEFLLSKRVFNRFSQLFPYFLFVIFRQTKKAAPERKPPPRTAYNERYYHS